MASETRWITLHHEGRARRIRADALVHYGDVFGDGPFRGWYEVGASPETNLCDETMEQITALLDSPRSGATEEAPR